MTRDKARSVPWTLFGVLLFAIALLTAVIGKMTTDHATSWHGSIVGGVVLATGASVGFLAQLCFKRARQISAPSAEELLRRDTRPPVLYLRSFYEDAFAAQLDNPTPTMIPVHLRTPEEKLAKALGAIGPVIAVAHPGESLPEAGAARLEAGEHWQNVVTTMMRRAGLVVLRPGVTRGVWWELETALREVDPLRLVVLLPDSDRMLEALRSALASTLPSTAGPLPPFDTPDDRRWGISRLFRSKGGATAPGALRGILYFERGWQPRVFRAAMMEGLFGPLKQRIAAELMSTPAAALPPELSAGSPADTAAQPPAAAAPMELPDSPILAALRASPPAVPVIRDPMRWGWVVLGALVLLATQAVFGVVLIALTLMRGTPVSFAAEASSALLSLPAAGALTAWLSPGATVREPALGGTLASGAIGILRGSTLSVIFIVTLAFTYAAIWAGARGGEALQARRAALKSA